MSDQLHTYVSGDTEDPISGPTWVVGLAAAILTLVTVLGVTALYYAAERAEAQHKVMSVRSQEAGIRREADRMALMNEAHWEQWTDADGVIAGERTLVVPMDTARDIVKKRWGGSEGGP
jgi:methyl coenzyme M reductase alpha subunit